RFVAIGGAKPVAPADPVVPGSNLLELEAYLLGLFVRVVLAKGLELYLLGEVDLAVLDDLPVVVRGLLLEAPDELAFLFLVEAPQRQEVVLALGVGNPRQNRREFAPHRPAVGKGANRLLQVDRADLLQ